MKKYFLFMVPIAIGIGFLFSCSQKEETKVSIPKTDSIVSSQGNASLESVITCPKCNFKKMEKLPTKVCLIKYTCTNCKTDLHPKEGDCCVFCTYGTRKCPSKQE